MKDIDKKDPPAVSGGATVGDLFDPPPITPTLPPIQDPIPDDPDYPPCPIL